MVGHLAYVADGSAGLQIVDLTDPAHPVQLGGYDTDGYVLHVQVVGDLEQSSRAARVGGFESAGSVRDLAVVGDHVYLADGSDGLVIVNVSNRPIPPW